MGSGKTQIAVDIAARISRGWLMPPRPRKPSRKRKPGNVLILSSEDDAATTIGPRFDVCGGDSDRCWVMGTDGEVMMFPTAIEKLSKMIVNNDIEFCVIDPLYGFLEGKIDANTDHKIRGPLRGLSDIAHKTGCAIFLTRHLNKKEDSSPLYRGGGSVAVAAHCPAALILGKNPTDESVRVLAGNRIKHARMPSALEYEMESREHPVGMSCRINWIGENEELSAEDILTNKKAPVGRPSRMEEYAEYIKELLTNGPMLADDLKERFMEKFKVSYPTFQTAKKNANVKSSKEGYQGKWMVSLG